MLAIVREFAEDVFVGGARPGQVQDRVVERLQKGRTWAGLGATAWLLTSYPLAEGRLDFALSKLLDLAVGFAVLCVTGLLAVTAFIAAARPPLRRVYLRRLRAPGAALRHMLVGAVLCGGSGKLVAQLLRGKVFPWHWVHSYGVLATVVAFLPFLMLLIVCAMLALMGAGAVLITAWYALASCFRLGDVHELLPALISPALVWSLFVLGLFDDPDVAAPPLVFYLFTLGGPVSVTALSVWELRRLRTRYGMTMRAALGRQTP